MPAERDLAEELGVSRLTLRSALARLETEGLVRSLQGSGTRVLDPREHGGIEQIGHLLGTGALDGPATARLLRDLLEFRRMVAIELVGLVAERATLEDLDGLKQHLHVLAEATADAERWMAADLLFARLLVRASQNFAIELVLNTVIRAILSAPALPQIFRLNARDTLVVYRRLLTVLEARDAVRATKITRRMLERLDRRTLELVGAR